LEEGVPEGRDVGGAEGGEGVVGGEEAFPGVGERHVDFEDQSEGFEERWGGEVGWAPQEGLAVGGEGVVEGEPEALFEEEGG
jgi:hypothetical protein